MKLCLNSTLIIDYNIKIVNNVFYFKSYTFENKIF